MDIKIDDEFKDLVPPLSKEEYDELEKGLLSETNADLITLVTWNGTLIDGHHRYKICQKYNIKFRTIEKQFEDRDDVKIWIIGNQLGRRNLNGYVKVSLALKREDIISKKAKANQEKGGQYREILNQGYQNSDKADSNNFKTVNPLSHESPRWNGTGSFGFDYPKEKNEPELSDDISDVQDRDDVKENISPIKPIHTNKELGEMAKISHDTIARIKYIEKHATDEQKKELDNNIKSVNEMYKKLKNEEIKK